MSALNMSGSQEDPTYSRGHTRYGSYSSLEFTYCCNYDSENPCSYVSSSFILHGTDARKIKYFDKFDWKKDKIIITHTVSQDNFNAILNFINGYEVLRKKYEIKEIINMLDLMNMLGCTENIINKFCTKTTSYLDLQDICIFVKDLPVGDPKSAQIISNLGLRDHFNPKEIRDLMVDVRSGALKNLSLQIKTDLFNKVCYYVARLDKFYGESHERKFFIILGKTKDEISCEYCEMDVRGNAILPQIIIDFCDHFGVQITTSKIKIKNWHVKKLFLNEKEIQIKYPTNNISDGLIGTNLENTIKTFLFDEITGLN